MNFWLWAEVTALVPVCHHKLRFWLLTKCHNLPADRGPDDLFRFLTWKQEFRGIFRSCFSAEMDAQFSSYPSLRAPVFLELKPFFSTLHSAAVLFSPLLAHPLPLSSWSVEFVLKREEQCCPVCSGIARIPDYQSFFRHPFCPRILWNIAIILVGDLSETCFWMTEVAVTDSLLKLASLGLRQDGLGFVHWLGFLFIFKNPRLGTEAWSVGDVWTVVL